jgi:hypothetical protein
MPHTPNQGTNRAISPDSSVQNELKRLERLADLLDSRYRIPGTRIRFGLDGLLGLVPVVGDTVVLLPSVWLVWRGWQLGVPRHYLTRMAANTGIDYVVGLVPFVGDFFDVAFKANLRNVRLLRRAIEEAPH